MLFTFYLFPGLLMWIGLGILCSWIVRVLSDRFLRCCFALVSICDIWSLIDFLKCLGDLLMCSSLPFQITKPHLSVGAISHKENKLPWHNNIPSKTHQTNQEEYAFSIRAIDHCVWWTDEPTLNISLQGWPAPHRRFSRAELSWGKRKGFCWSLPIHVDSILPYFSRFTL